MAGAAPTARPAPFLRPLDRLDRGVLLAESALSLVVVVLMLFAAVSESSWRLLQSMPAFARVGLCAALWILLVGLKLAGTPGEPSPAQRIRERLGHGGDSRTRALQVSLVQFVPIGIGLGWLTEQAMRAVLPIASDVLLHGTLWAAFLGASFATRGRKHLAIDAVSRQLPDRGRRLVIAFSSTLGAFIAFALANGIFQSLGHTAHEADAALQELIHAGATNASVDRSYAFQYVIPAGFTLIGLRLVLHAFHEFVAAMAGTSLPDPAVATATPPRSTDVDGVSVVAVAHNGGVVDEPRPQAAVATATALEVAIALGAMCVLNVITWGSAVMKPAMALSFVAALTLVVPLVLRKMRTGSYEPVGREPDVAVKGSPVHFVAAAVAVASVLAVMRYGLAPRIGEIPVGAGIAFFACMALLGAPLFSFLGGMGLFLFVKHFLEDPSEFTRANAYVNSVEDVLGNHFARMSVLATIPLFTLAGYIMSESKMPQRLVRVSRALLGWLPGGLAVVCVFASAFFTIFSGASGITIVAVGGLLVPALLKDHYPEKFSLGLVTTGGALGITVPPCLPLIVYGIVAGLQEPAPGQERLELQKFLLCGLLPGLVAIGLMVGYCIIVGMASKVPRSRFDAAEAAAALWEAKWELVLPVFLLAGLATGIFNPQQGAAFTAFYVLVVEVFIYKDLTVGGDLPRIVPESMVLVGAIFVKLCAATVLVGYFVQAQTADKLFEWLTCGPPALNYMHQHADSIGTCREAVDSLSRMGHSAGGIINSKLTFLIGLNFFLIIVGMLMDIFSAIVVIVPLIMGIALHFHINPYHLGIVFLLNLEIGYLMPPMGLNLFIAGFRFNRPVPSLYPMVLPFIGLFVVALMVTTYIPSLTTVMIGHDTANTPHVAANTGPGTTNAQPAAGDGGAAAVIPQSDCDVPRDDEDAHAFELRCHFDFDGDGIIGPPGDGGHAVGDGAAAAP